MYNILTFNLHTCSPWHADFASDWLLFNSYLIERLHKYDGDWLLFNSYLIERLHKYDGCDVDMDIRQN